MLETHACIYSSNVIHGVVFCILYKVSPLKRYGTCFPPVSAFQIAELLMETCLFLTYNFTESCSYLLACVHRVLGNSEANLLHTFGK